MEFHNTREIKKTRKDHRCVHCHEMIPKGRACFYAAGKYDGDFFSLYSHRECEDEYMRINEGAGHDDWAALEDEAYEWFHNWRKNIRELYGLNLRSTDG